MAIENTYLLGKNITLGCGFDLQAKAPLDSRQTVPSTAGLQALIDGNAAYEGMIVYDEESKKTYQAQIVDDVLAFREFGINEAELKDLIASETTAAMEFKGAATALPENPAKGDMYKVTTSFKVGEEDVKVGDSIVYDGEQWFIIPSGDDIEDTWRPVTGVDNDSTLTFAAGDKLEKTVAADGTITYKHEAIDAPEDMTAEDDEKTRTYITQLITDNHGHIIGFKTATENVEDTNTEYTFEGQSDKATSVYFQVTSNEEGASAEVVYLDAYSKNEADGKFVAKETGKSLVSDDEIARLAEVDNYDDEEVRGLIGDNAQAIEDLEAYVGTVPTDDKYKDLSVVAYINKKAEETLAAAQGGSSETAASVKQQLDNYKSENDTRVETAEKAIDAIEADYLKTADKTELADAIAGVKATADSAAVKTDVETALSGKVDKEAYDADKATFAIAETVNAALDLKANAADVVANDTFESFKTANTQAIADAKAGAVSDVEAKGYAVATEVAETYATKTELGNVDAKFANYNTTVAQKAIDDAQDARIKAIEDDYVVAADIADFETKANVKKVADDLAAYVETNDAALAAETKARTDADAGFETRIAALEGNFGDGEGTVEAQIAAAVKAEEDARKEAVQGVQDEVDAVEGRMDTAEGKITALETESAKHAIKTEVEGALDLKADKSALEATDKTLAEVKTTVDNFFAEDAAINDTIDTLKEIANYIATDKEGAADITARVGALEGKVDVDKVSEAIDADVKVETDRATAAESALSGRIDTLEAIDHTAYVAADTALKTELNAEIAKKADSSTVTAMDEAYKAADTALSGRIKDLEDNKSGYATTGEVATAKSEAIAAAETKAAELDAALKTELQKEIDDDVKALADTVYTKSEVEALLTWGSF